MPKEKKEPWWGMLLRPPAIFVLVGFVAWWGFVVFSGSGRGIGGPWDFSITGQLGDSFGVLSALMTSLAAIFTYQTLVDTRLQRTQAEEAAALQKREADEAKEELKIERARASEREEERAAAEKRRDAEQTFFRLMELRLRVLEDVRTGRGDTLKIGSDAFDRFVNQVASSSFEYHDHEIHKLQYDAVYKRNVNDLGHYFRFTYHIMLFAKENFGRHSYKYVRLLRAQLSNAEIVIIALNCAYGEGREKMAPLVERYSLLHNMDRVNRARFQLNQYFKDRAFNPQAGANDVGQPSEDLGEVLLELKT